MTNALAGINVLVTRPQHQAEELSEKIRAEGGNPVMFPVLEIRDVEDPQPLLNLIDRLQVLALTRPDTVRELETFFERDAARGSSSRPASPSEDRSRA